MLQISKRYHEILDIVVFYFKISLYKMQILLNFLFSVIKNLELKTVMEEFYYLSTDSVKDQTCESIFFLYTIVEWIKSTL